MSESSDVMGVDSGNQTWQQKENKLCAIFAWDIWTATAPGISTALFLTHDDVAATDDNADDSDE